MFDCIDDPNVLKFSSTQNSDQQEWRDAAYQWRLPYWDWASKNDSKIPSIFVDKTIQVREPRGDDGKIPTPKTIDPNPCYQYRLPKKPNSNDSYTFQDFGMPVPKDPNGSGMTDSVLSLLEHDFKTRLNFLSGTNTLAQQGGASM